MFQINDNLDLSKNLQKTWIAWLRKMKLFSPADEILPYKRPENNFLLRWAIHRENAIWNIQIFAYNLNELIYLRGLFVWEK